MTALLALGLALVTGAPVLNSRAAPRPVVLVLAPALEWANAPEALRSMAYSRANLSVRSARQRGTAADGFLSIGAGARAATPKDLGVGAIVDDGEGLRLRDWSRLRRHQSNIHSDARIGALGQRLEAAGRSWAFVGDDRRGAAAAANRVGSVPRVHDDVASALGSGVDAVVVGAHLGSLAKVLSEAAVAARCVIVASVSTTNESRHLGAFAASQGCGLPAGGLSSPSTKQPALVTLADVTAAYLWALDVDRGGAMTGRRVRAGGSASFAVLVDKDERSSSADYVRTRFVWFFVALHAGAAFLALWRPAWRSRLASFLLAWIPASYLMMLAPWWRWRVAGGVLTAAGLSAVIALLVSRASRDDVRMMVGIGAALAALVIGGDAVLGGPLEIDAPFGNSPIGGGRYYGVGNIGFAFLVGSLLVAAALAFERWGRRALPFVGAAFAGGLVVNGAPWFGADAGGVVASAPAYGALVGGYRRGRPTLKAVAGVFLVGVAVVVLFAVVDSTRPEDEQTHLTRTLTGTDLVETAGRKGQRALNTFTTPLANVIVVGTAVLVAARPRLADRPALRAGAWALGLAGVAGSVLNDSGLQIGAAVMAVAWPAYVAISSGGD